MYNNVFNSKDNIEFLKIIEDLRNNPTVKKMKLYRQHYSSSCYEHCLEVSFFSYKVCKKLGLDYKSSARAGLLHDLFLYNWRLPQNNLPVKGLHAFAHPKIALINSMKITRLNKKEKDIIVKHMWPVTLFNVPRYKESFIITIVDKYSALRSTYRFYKNKTIYMINLMKNQSDNNNHLREKVHINRI